MNTPNLSRRALLGAGTLLAGVGFSGASFAQSLLSSSLLAEIEAVRAAVIQTALAELPGTAARLSQAGRPPALVSAMTNIQAGLSAHGGLAHQAKVCRATRPSAIVSHANPHFVVQGAPFSAGAMRNYAPQAAHGTGV